MTKISCILLAAGNSNRFGENKLVTVFEGKMLFEHILDKLVLLPLEEIIVVTQYEEIQKKCKNLNIHSEKNSYPQKGVGYSIKLGISCAKSVDGYLFVVADQPKISLFTLKELIRRFQLDSKNIWSVSYNKKRGNPVIFPASYKEELLSLTGDEGGRQVVKRHLDTIKTYEVTNKEELLDIDTKEDKKHLETRG